MSRLVERFEIPGEEGQDVGVGRAEGQPPDLQRRAPGNGLLRIGGLFSIDSFKVVKMVYSGFRV
jgi:hypothetical protein